MSRPRAEWFATSNADRVFWRPVTIIGTIVVAFLLGMTIGAQSVLTRTTTTYRLRVEPVPVKIAPQKVIRSCAYVGPSSRG